MLHFFPVLEKKQEARTDPFDSVWQGGWLSGCLRFQERNIFAWAICSAKEGGSPLSFKRTEAEEISGNPMLNGFLSDMESDEISRVCFGFFRDRHWVLRESKSVSRGKCDSLPFCSDICVSNGQTIGLILDRPRPKGQSDLGPAIHRRPPPKSG